jgi:hypothetical protein
MSARTRPPTDLEAFGSFMVRESIAVGEAAEAFVGRAFPGRWQAFASGDDEPHLDVLDDSPPRLLLCVAEPAVPRIAELYATAQPVAAFAIEGARVVVGDAALAVLFTGSNAMDNFYEHLDGVHGPLTNGAGVTMMLDGDGRGSVRVACLDDLAALVAIEIR